jgi:methyl-accepting chemotaxis protein
MKIKFKLSIVVITIMAAVVAGITSLLLWQSSKNALELSLRSQEHLTNSRVEFWKGREDGLIRTLNTLANVLGDYESIKPEERRDKFDTMLMSAFKQEPLMTVLYTVWNPNALDGMDAKYIGRTGSGPTGQYAMAWSKETGNMIKRQSNDIENVMNHINGPNKFKALINEPQIRNIKGVDKYTLRMIVPIVSSTNNEEVVGAVGCVFDMDMMQNIVENTIRNNDEINMLIIYSAQGTVLAHYKPERIGKNMMDVDVELGSARTDLLNAIKNNTVYKGKVYEPDLDDTMRFVAKPFQIGNSDSNWMVLIGIPESYVLKEIKAITNFTIILAAIAIVATAVIFVIVLGYITKPIVTVTDTLKDISQGEGDLTKTIPEKGNDEISDMSRYFNLTLEKIKKLVVSIKEHATVLSDTGNDLSSNMVETAAAMNQITANIQSIKNRIINQSASVTQTNAAMEQITGNIDKLNGYVEKQAANVSQSSSAIEEMLANIQSVTNTLEKNGVSVNELNSSSEVGRESLEEAFSSIQEITRDSEKLLKINMIIADIAAQTNLLSMNAAIEAAHAGTAGRGFAVVADEIRTLAISCTNQSKTIGDVLNKVKESIDYVHEITGNTLAKFKVIDSSVKTVSEQEENIRNAMTEQNEGSKQILDAVGQLNEITRQVKEESIEMYEESRGVIQESRTLDQVTQEITGGINEMASGAQQINEAVNKVNEITMKNRENISHLVREVSLFKVA